MKEIKTTGRTAQFGHWGIALLRDGKLVARLLYPATSTGPIEGDAPTRAMRKEMVQRWIDSAEIDSQFLTVDV